ncbi:espin-like protein isoform X2 [Narcine bancroftii]|uniref:espin-like protein isoform X2 n=1 Tax=Narcine bancroftii TaxID=1343680 RepID=UPI003832181B
MWLANRDSSGWYQRYLLGIKAHKDMKIIEMQKCEDILFTILDRVHHQDNRFQVDYSRELACFEYTLRTEFDELDVEVPLWFNDLSLRIEESCDASYNVGGITNQSLARKGTVYLAVPKESESRWLDSDIFHRLSQSSKCSGHIVPGRVINILKELLKGAIVYCEQNFLLKPGDVNASSLNFDGPRIMLVLRNLMKPLRVNIIPVFRIDMENYLRKGDQNEKIFPESIEQTLFTRIDISNGTYYQWRFCFERPIKKLLEKADVDGGHRLDSLCILDRIKLNHWLPEKDKRGLTFKQLQDRDDHGANVLHLAARFGRSETVRWLLQAGCDPMLETDSGAVPAHYAAAKGDLTSLKMILTQTPRALNKQTQNGATPLYLACQEGHLHIVEYLIKDCKANLNLRTHDGMTVFHAASQMGHCGLVLWLMSFTETDVSVQDNEGATAMHFAASGGHAKVLDQLLRMGAEMLKDNWGGTPLHDAAENGELECCQILVMNHMDPTIQDEDGYTAAELADYNGNVECAMYLRHVEKMLPLEEPPVSKQRQESIRKSKSTVIHQSRGDYYQAINEGHKEWRGSQQEMEDTKSERLKLKGKSKEKALIPLPAEEVPSADVDLLVPTHDEKGCPIPEWKRQVMVRKLQARLLDEEEQRREHKGRGYLQTEIWRYSQEHNAILGPFGELLTEDDLIYLEKQIENVQMMKRCQEYGGELNRLAVQLRTILPAPIVNITVNTQLLNQDSGREEDTPLPVWCNRISGIVRTMSLLLSNVNEKDRSDYESKEITKIPNTELAAVFTPRLDQTSSRKSRNKVEKEIQQFGVSVRSLRANFEKQYVPREKTIASTKPLENQEYISENKNNNQFYPVSPEHRVEVQSAEDVYHGTNTCEDESWQKYIAGVQGGGLSEEQMHELRQSGHMGDTSELGINSKGDVVEDHAPRSPVTESTSLRKERIVVLFLGHWKKSTYTMSLKMKLKNLCTSSTVENSNEPLEDGKMMEKEESSGKPDLETHLEPQPKQSISNEKLRHLFLQQRTITKLIGNWRNIISHVPSRQIRRLNRQRITYSPEQFLPRVNGLPADYDSLTLDLFMLGYFHILELDLPPDERKMRHLLCFEVFDHLGTFSWDLVRAFHKAVIEEIDAGKREWKNGFEDIKQRFFSNPESMVAMPSQSEPTIRQVPKVIVQSATPEEEEMPTGHGHSDLGAFTNDDICKYIDRSFAFWKDKEAEIFDFEE